MVLTVYILEIRRSLVPDFITSKVGSSVIFSANNIHRILCLKLLKVSELTGRQKVNR